MVSLRYTIIRNNGKELYKKHHADAGADICYCPNWTADNYGLIIKGNPNGKVGVSIKFDEIEEEYEEELQEKEPEAITKETGVYVRKRTQKNKEALYVRGLVTLKPLAKALFPTGIKLLFPENYVVMVCNRGSVGSDGLVVGAHIIDSGYTGEVFVDLHNISNTQKLIEPGQRIAQLLLLPVITTQPIYMSQRKYDNAIKTLDSNRGDGKLASTGKF